MNTAHSTFSHEAMACTWELVIAGQDAAYAEQAAWAAWDEVDRLENELSRFSPSSDVAQINNAAPGQEVQVGIAAIECLLLAAAVHQITAGAFDVTLGQLVDHQRAGPEMPAAPAPNSSNFSKIGMEMLHIDAERRLVRIEGEGATIDLGGIGKGYAVDQVATILQEWGITSVLISSGQSTVLALGSPDEAAGATWSVALRDPRDQKSELGTLPLRDQALSGSGMQLHGRHIFDPHSGNSAAGKLATWTLTASAALSDALSTAFMVMPAAAVEDFCRRHPEVSGLLLLEAENGPAAHAFGAFETIEITLSAAPPPQPSPAAASTGAASTGADPCLAPYLNCQVEVWTTGSETSESGRLSAISRDWLELAQSREIVLLPITAVRRIKVGGESRVF